MAFSRFTQVVPNTGSPTVDKILNLLQQNLDKILTQIVNVSSLDRQQINNIVLTAGQTNAIPHKLNRVLSGYNVVLRNAQCRIWDSQTTNANPSLLLNLHTDGNVTVSLEVW